MGTPEADQAPGSAPAPHGRWLHLARLGCRHPTATFGLVLLLATAVGALLAPWLGTTDPVQIAPLERLRPPSAQNWFGTDLYGRDVYSRTVYGGRVSLFVGLSVAVLSVLIGLLVGLVSGYSRRATRSSCGSWTG